MNGILILNKPEGMTSFRAVSVCRSIYRVKKAGHAGTLDPLATGVLPILLGCATALSEFLLCDQKRYLATFQIGVATDTQDLTGTVVSSSGNRPDWGRWQEAARALIGEIEQVPPMYSALKQNGVPLYKLARQGKSVERAPRKIRIFDLALAQTDDPDVLELDVTCSKGTYIRTLIEDLAKAAGTCAAMRTLVRVAHGDFSIDDAHPLSAVEEAKGDENRLKSLLIPVETVLSGYPELHLSAFSARICKCGAEIYREREGYTTDLLPGDRVRLYDEHGNFFALGETRVFESGEAVKPIRFFFEQEHA